LKHKRLFFIPGSRTITNRNQLMNGAIRGEAAN